MQRLLFTGGYRHDAARRAGPWIDINQLPIAYNIAWYEQKAVIVLLALLSLGVKNIHLGPTPAGFPVGQCCQGSCRAVWIIRNRHG